MVHRDCILRKHKLFVINLLIFLPSTVSKYHHSFNTSSQDILRCFKTMLVWYKWSFLSSCQAPSQPERLISHLPRCELIFLSSVLSQKYKCSTVKQTEHTKSVHHGGFGGLGQEVIVFRTQGGRSKWSVRSCFPAVGMMKQQSGVPGGDVGLRTLDILEDRSWKQPQETFACSWFSFWTYPLSPITCGTTAPQWGQSSPSNSKWDIFLSGTVTIEFAGDAGTFSLSDLSWGYFTRTTFWSITEQG